jgi:hypothetical protein
VTVQPWTLTARLYPGRPLAWDRELGRKRPEPSPWMPVSLEEKLVVSGALGLALAAAFWPKGRR